MPINPRKVIAIAYDRLHTFEFAVAVECFGFYRDEVQPPYEFKAVSIDPPPIRAIGGFTITTSSNLRELRDAGTIIIPGWRKLEEKPPDRLLDALKKAHENGTRLVSFCSGVFVLAAAGLLDGRRATTHWRHADTLAEMYPQIRIEPDNLYIDEGNVMTAAGSAAGIDLALHLIRNDHGAEVANAVARRLVVPPHREGGQAQFIASPMHTTRKSSIAELLDWLRQRLHEDHTVESIAEHFHMSPRTLSRRFRNATGTSPHRWLLRERTFLAQQLLETTDKGVERIAADCGFGSSQLLRFHFRRTLGTSPTSYRSTFRSSSPQ